MLTNDWHLAQDLLQDTLTQLFVKWDRVDLDNQPDAYARTTMFHLFVSRRRRASSRELVSDQLPERIFVGADSATRIDLARSLSELTPTERAVIVGRYVEDLPVAEVASLVGDLCPQDLGCMIVPVADGDVAVMDGAADGKRGQNRHFAYVRADGASVYLWLDNVRFTGDKDWIETRATLPLTDEQGAALVSDPAWDELLEAVLAAES